MKVTSKINPISPKEIIENLELIIPDAVVTAVNNLLKREYRGNGYVSFKKKELISEIKKTDTSLTERMIYDNHWLDIEKLYEKYGWTVKFESPSYGNSNFEDYYEFHPKKSSKIE